MIRNRRTSWVEFSRVSLVALVAILGQPAGGAEPAKLALPPVLGPDGKNVDLRPPKGGVTAVVFYSSECPISNAYSPTLNRLADDFPRSKLNLVGLCVDPDLTDAEVKAHAKDFGLKCPVARDRNGAVGVRVGATVTPEAFVIDEEGRIRYHGRIDDQFAARQQRNATSSTSELRDAIAAVLEGKKVAVEHVKAVGCPIPKPAKEALRPTYTRDVAAILQRNCQECHRHGQVGPFPLETYEQARKRARDISTVVEGHQMPPWKPDPHFGPKFKNDRSLSAAECATLTAWAESGALEGDRADLPPPVRFADDWTFGTPDLVLEMPEDFAVPAEGDDIYRCFVIPTNLPADKYIAAIEYRPGNRRVVHHILSYVNTNGDGRKRDAADPGQGYSCFSGPGVDVHGDLGGWAPGNEPARLPDGVGRLLPSKADVVVQVHYHPSGKAETDRTRIGIHFARKPVKQILHWAQPGEYPDEPSRRRLADGDQGRVGDPRRCRGARGDPAHAPPRPRHRHDDSLSRWPDAGPGADRRLGFQLAEHLLLREAARHPQGIGAPRCLHITTIPRGNAHNPNHPPKLVTWGEATTDEMCIGFIAVTKKGQDLTKPGEKDDLRSIIDGQIAEARRKMEAQGRPKPQHRSTPRPKAE